MVRQILHGYGEGGKSEKPRENVNQQSEDWGNEHSRVEDIIKSNASLASEMQGWTVNWDLELEKTLAREVEKGLRWGCQKLDESEEMQVTVCTSSVLSTFRKK